MSVIFTKSGNYRLTEYKRENELETAILQVKEHLFGANRLYFNIKRKIGLRDEKQNVPDGYLIDLSGQRPPNYTWLRSNSILTMN